MGGVGGHVRMVWIKPEKHHFSMFACYANNIEFSWLQNSDLVMTFSDYLPPVLHFGRSTADSLSGISKGEKEEAESDMWKNRKEQRLTWIHCLVREIHTLHSYSGGLVALTTPSRNDTVPEFNLWHLKSNIMLKWWMLTLWRDVLYFSLKQRFPVIYQQT